MYHYRKAFLIVCVALTCLLSFGCSRELSVNSQSSKHWESLNLNMKLVRELRIHKNLLFACACRDGLFRLDTRAVLSGWEYLGFADTTLARDLLYGVTSVFIDSKETVFVGISTPETDGIGLFRSIDYGLTWIPSDSGIRPPDSSTVFPISTQVQAIEGISSPQQVMMLGMEASIYKSTDGGLFWKIVNGRSDAGGLGIHTIEFNTAKPNEVWAGGESGRFAPLLFFSDDFGNNWNDINLFPHIAAHGFSSDNAVYDIVSNPDNENIVYLGMKGLVLKSVDKGKSWSCVLCNENDNFMHWRLSLNPFNPNELLVTGKRIFHTYDGGGTWHTLGLVKDSKAYYALEVDWVNRILYASTSSPNYSVYRRCF